MIDRHALITRHNPLYTKLETKAPLSVGNGGFCFTADFTGLQTFSAEYAAEEDAFPLCTMAEWGWHSYADAIKDDSLLRLEPFDTWGRTVNYAVCEAGQEAVFKGLRQNAHKFHVGKIGFECDGKLLSFRNTQPLIQQLNLWEGVLYSDITVDGAPVKTETFVHPEEDAVYIRSVSPLIKTGKLCIALTFPYGSHKKDAADFTRPLLHKTRLIRNTNGVFIFEREMDGTRYQVTAAGSGVDVIFCKDSHTAVFFTSCAETLTLAFRFEPISVPAMALLDGSYAAPPQSGIPHFDAAKRTCMAFWETYWTQGGAIDLSRSSDSRAHELERRVVLSQYLTAIQSRGRLPPAETGLTCNSWYGKFHFEMYYWHAAHFALWGRKEELKKSLAYYKTILPVARKIAASQGYRGARWPKMCDSTAYNTPSSIAVLLIWQQPHPIMLAELCYRAGEREAFLREYRDVIVETAEFMVSFLHWDGNRYVLGPPYIPAQERHDPASVLNAAYELEYFRWGLQQADVWLNRLGEKPHFGDVADKLALPSQKDGVYLAHENCPDTFTKLPFYTDHPSMLAMYGVLNSRVVDPAIMSATLDKALAVWDMNTFYGWDFPMLAMCAARLGRKEDALRLLLMESPKNTYLPNGHNKQTGNGDLPLYLPGNGGLLLSVAMMSVGWEGDGGKFVPGLPDDGSFVVNMENLVKYV
ncbi:MAG: hypothetical protein LBB61_10720 [Treponema sp.]|nr:hypothetical protein [Treponema sp.]